MDFSTLLILIFMIMFWLFRAIVAVCTQYSIDLIGIVSYNLNLEIIISFAVIICIVLVAKRKIIGALVYTLVYGMYFGEHFFNEVINLFKGETLTMDMSANLICDFIAILLVIFCLFDTVISKSKNAPKNKNTDWYFENSEYDKELEKRDKRDDKNQYKFY